MVIDDACNHLYSFDLISHISASLSLSLSLCVCVCVCVCVCRSVFTSFLVYFFLSFFLSFLFFSFFLSFSFSWFQCNYRRLQITFQRSHTTPSRVLQCLISSLCMARLLLAFLQAKYDRVPDVPAILTMRRARQREKRTKNQRQRSVASGLLLTCSLSSPFFHPRMWRLCSRDRVRTYLRKPSQMLSYRLWRRCRTIWGGQTAWNVKFLPTYIYIDR